MGIFDILKKSNNNNYNLTDICELNYENVEKWIDEIFIKKMPNNIIAFNFNLYEDQDNKWSIELIGSDKYDPNNDDWACSEIFTTRNSPFVFSHIGDWNEVLNEVKHIISTYLNTGKYNVVLKSSNAVSIGFVDGDLVCLYRKGGN